ncbi:transcription factor E2F3 [Eleginops maclovinus]
MKRSHDGVVDLNLVATELNAPKRRLYDVTNVLEGIKLIKKKSKNYIEWLGGDVNTAAKDGLQDLVEEERILDELIFSCTRQVHRLYEDQSAEKFAYLTYEDIQKIPSLKEQTVIVIKAPAETKLEVPHPEESLQVHLSSTQGPIEAFLCSENPVPMGASGGSVSLGSHVHPYSNGKTSTQFVPYSPFVQVSSKDKASRTSGLDNISNTPSGLTQHSLPATPVSPMHTSLQTPSGDPQSFVTLVPPRTYSVDGGEYLLSLAEDEGITDLFSSFELDHLPMDVPIL